MNGDILEKRLQAEAARHAISLEEARIRVLELGLDAAKERRDSEARARDITVDVLLVTATLTEHRELRNVAESHKLPFQKRQGRLGPYYHLGRIGSNRVASIQVSMGAFGSEGSAARCIQARAETQATTLILLGTAFGVNAVQQRIGDVLVSESVFLYDDRHAVDDSTAGSGYRLLFPPSARRPASATWVERFRQTAGEYERTAEAERVMIGTLLSGGARIESARFRDELINTIPAMESPIIGGEMEAIGAVSASTTDIGDEPGWIVVKGIADFADGPSRAEIETTRATAARSSARTVLRTLQSTAKLI